ncbi:MAG: von Willebrand factor type A domain-containing protein [Puniceicoccaceae bacterium]
MDDPFAPPSLSRPSAAPARSEPSIAGEKAKDARPADEMPLMGRLFADEAGRSERRTANETAELKKLPDAPPAEREPKPQPRPAPPPAQPARFTDTGRDNFSTFSLNVTDVSFQLAARQLEQGIAPDPRSIRQEEFYNAFDYRDPAPAAGEPVRFEVESATVPGSHNRKVVRLAVKTAAQSGAAGKPAQITFAVDNSGSMQRSDRKSTIQAAFDRLTDGLGPRDRINIVTFATDSRLELLQSPPSNPSGIKAALNSAPEGGTNLEKGLATAYGVAARYYDPAYGNRVVLLSDGIANLGRTEADQLAGMIEGNRNRGIAFDGFGIGWENLNDPLLAELARNGDGHYAFLNAPADAEKIFARALSRSLQSVARDVKVQVEWNADRVRRFRLIGYETHLLKKEDFRNDAVDAAEMAAEETGNAIYLVELKPNGTGPLGTARVRFKMASPPAPPSEEAERILDRLESVVIPRVTFAGASLSDAAQELTMLTEAQNPDGIEGISMRATGDSDDRQVNFSVRNLPVIRILDIMSQQTGYEWGIADNMVTFHPRGERLTSTQERAGSSPTVEERSWIIPNPPVWPEIEAASPRLQLATAAAVFADKLQDSNRFSAVDRAQLLAWTQQAQAFFNNPAEIETLANMIRNATFLP